MLKPGAALLFDIDGTLADTDAFHIEATNRVFGRFGHVFDRARYNAEIQGFTMDDITRRLLPAESTGRRHELMAEKEVIFRALARSEIAPVAGLMALLNRADVLGIPMVAVTNAPRLNAEMILGGLGITHRFRTVISGEELPEGEASPHALSGRPEGPRRRCRQFLGIRGFAVRHPLRDRGRDRDDRHHDRAHPRGGRRGGGGRVRRRLPFPGDRGMDARPARCCGVGIPESCFT